MALNKEDRKACTAHRRALVKQTSILCPVVTAPMRVDSARRNRLETRITGTGRHLPLSVFKPLQLSYGVRARIWGRAQTYRSAFLGKGYGNEAFKRVGRARLPAINVEARRLIGLMLGGRRIGSLC